MVSLTFIGEVLPVDSQFMVAPFRPAWALTPR
jgi:hypothetical protein